MARPADLTPEVKKIILEAVRKGHPYKRAAHLAGISETTIYNCKVRGKQEQGGEFLSSSGI